MAGGYEIEVRHDGLHKYRHIRGTDAYVVQEKARAQVAAWNEMWERKLAAEELKAERMRMADRREERAAAREERKGEAAELTESANAALSELEALLAVALERRQVIDWNGLKDRRSFTKPKPRPPSLESSPPRPSPEDKPRKEDMPKSSNSCYEVKHRIWDDFFPSRRAKKEQAARARFEADLARWNARVDRWNRDVQRWKSAVEEQRQRHAAAVAGHQRDVELWEAEHREFLEQQWLNNKSIDAKSKLYADGDPAAVYDYCDMVLSDSQYPEFFPQEYELEYLPDSKTLIVDYRLPSLDDIPTLKEVRYVQSRDELSEKHLSEAAKNKLYDAVLYQVVLRSVHELFDSDAGCHLDAVGFNGWVEGIDKATGKETRGCVLTVRVERHEYEHLNLHSVDPKVCFKRLKGVGSAQLHSMTPVAPIMRISRDDSRFISAYSVVGDLDDSVNLAAMDWEDFEHLIRELFEKEFTATGGEVKVTQASRDGGVDAVAFDPDPIRGGKIVIQAKRYTNTVGVSAVRDLYGTVLNEGATKGILVTTSDYGSDAYAFAKDKPLTLLNGGNLLHLLQKHGHRARINVREAKKLLASR